MPSWDSGTVKPVALTVAGGAATAANSGAADAGPMVAVAPRRTASADVAFHWAAAVSPPSPAVVCRLSAEAPARAMEAAGEQVPADPASRLGFFFIGRLG
jgi:hypothetical protein